MEDRRVAKLARLLEDADIAEKLVRSGLDTPRKIKGASKKRLEEIDGIGSATSDKIKTRFGGQR